MSKLENVIAKVTMAIDNVTNVNQAFIAILIALVSIYIFLFAYLCDDADGRSPSKDISRISSFSIVSTILYPKRQNQ